MNDWINHYHNAQRPSGLAPTDLVDVRGELWTDAVMVADVRDWEMVSQWRRCELEIPPAQSSPLSQQVGGDHYRSMAIQPVEFAHANGLGYCEAAVVKYVSRYKSKNGKADLEKARHFIDLLIELEYGSR